MKTFGFYITYMSDSESTPIENVLEVEQNHEADANAALAELSGAPPVAQSPPPSSFHPSPSQDMYEDSFVESSNSELDMWISIVATATTVFIAVFVLFLPSVRVLLEPMIGTGYIALGIRSAVIGSLSILPYLVLM